MNKLYDLITFHNGTTPDLNEDNMNAMSQALDDIDDRVVSLGGAVLEVIPDLEDMLSNAEELEQYRNDAVEAEGNAEAYAVGTRGGDPVGPSDPAYHNNAKYYSEQTDPTAFANMSDVDFDNLQNGQVPVWNATARKWKNGSGGGGGGTAADVSYDNTSSGLSASNVQTAIDEVNTDANNFHKVTSITVSTTGWTQDTTSQSGTTLYKKSISLNHVYANPSVDIGCASGSVLPTTAQQEAYDLLEYVTVDGTTMYLYASDIPTDTFYINVEGVD